MPVKNIIIHVVIVMGCIFSTSVLFAQWELHDAVKKMNPQRVRELLNEGADPNEQDPSGCTPLHYAVFRSQMALAVQLLRVGASPFIRNKYSHTAQDLAVIPVIIALLSAWEQSFNQFREIFMANDDGDQVAWPLDFRREILQRAFPFQ